MQPTRTRLAIAGAFATQGFVFIGLTTRLPDFSDRWGLSELELSGLLLMMVLLAGVGSVLAEKLAERHDSAGLLRLGLGLVTVGVPLLGLAPQAAVFWAGMAVYGVGLGIIDATTNMQGVALEHVYGRPILPSFHGAWTLGGVIGAAVTLGTPDAPLGAVALLAALPLAVAFAPFVRRDRGIVAAVAEVAVPWRPILLVGAALVLFYMVDTAAATVGTDVPRHHLRDPERPGGAGDVPLPGRQRAGPARRRPDRGEVRRRRRAAHRRRGGLAGPGRRGLRPRLAGGGRSASPCSAPAWP